MDAETPKPHGQESPRQLVKREGARHRNEPAGVQVKECTARPLRVAARVSVRRVSVPRRTRPTLPIVTTSPHYLFDRSPRWLMSA